MAGSMSWQVYTSDNGTDYALFCDLSNALAVNASASATPGTLPSTALPSNIKPRYAIYISDDGKTQRKVPILKASDLAALAPNDNFVTNPGGVTVKLSSIRGEKIRLPKLVDTGLTT